MDELQVKELAVRGFCQHPIRLRVREGDGTRYVKCGSKSFHVCEPCASRYRSDRKRIIGSGCNVYEGLDDGVTELMLSGYNFYYLTLTAPSFGAVHRAPKPKDSNPGKCSCGRRHKVGDDLTGTPLKPKNYRYNAQIDWNSNFGNLFHYTMKYLTDRLPGMAYNSAREWQKRGALHTHLVIRVPKDVDESYVNSILEDSKSYRFGDYGWGSQLDVQQLIGDKAQTVGYLAKVVGYTAKSQDKPENAVSDPMKAHHAKLQQVAMLTPCTLGQRCTAKDCKRRSHTNFGFGGHLMTSSRDWSLVGLTLKAIRNQRITWATKNAAIGNETDQKLRFANAVKAERGQEILAELWSSMDDDLNERFYADGDPPPIGKHQSNPITSEWIPKTFPEKLTAF